MKRFEKHVGPLIIATTRPRASAQKVLKLDAKQQTFAHNFKHASLKHEDGCFNLEKRPGIYNNGTVVVGSDGNVIHETFFESTTVVKCMEWMIGRQTDGKSANAPCFLSGDKLYVVDNNDAVSTVARDYWNLDTEELGDFWVRKLYNPREPQDEIKVSVLFLTAPEEELAGEQGEKTMRVLQMICGNKANVYKMAPSIVCIQQAGVNKGTALQKLFELDENLKLSADNLMTIGSSNNDIDMIITSKVGVAMDNSSIDLLNFADVVTSSNGDQGAKKVLDLLSDRAKSNTKNTKDKVKNFKNHAALSQHIRNSILGATSKMRHFSFRGQHNASAENPSPAPSIENIPCC